jgi:hypothetical protein
VSGNNLPGARLLSIVLFADVPIPDPVWTLAAMQWGQIMTHDMSMAMGTTQASKNLINFHLCDIILNNDLKEK